MSARSVWPTNQIIKVVVPTSTDRTCGVVSYEQKGVISVREESSVQPSTGWSKMYARLYAGGMQCRKRLRRGKSGMDVKVVGLFSVGRGAEMDAGRGSSRWKMSRMRLIV